MRYLALFMLLTACGPEYVFEYPNIEGFYVKTNANYDPEDIAKNIRFARNLIIQNTIVDDNTWNQYFRNASLTIKSESVWRDPFLGLVIGVTDSALNIQVNDTMDSLLHEMLHRFEAKHGDLETWHHYQWEEKGYNKIDKEFSENKFGFRRIAFPAN